MQQSNLWQLDNYNAPITALFDVGIYEYDISRANISVLADAGKISEDQYLIMFNMPREDRQVIVGLMQRTDPQVGDILKEGFCNARHKLFDLLNLEDNNVLHVNKDAVFVVKRLADTVIAHTDFIPISSHVEFTLRSKFNIYFRVGPSIHFYYDYDLVAGKDVHKIRGMSEESQKLYEVNFTSLLDNIFRAQQISGFSAAYNLCKEYYNDLMHGKLPAADYGRRFDNSSEFDIRYDSIFGTMRAEYLSENTSAYVDPSYNLQILANLGNVLLSYMMMYGNSNSL